MNAQEIISSGLLELYATGAATPLECQEVEQGVRQFPEVAKELHNISIALENYAMAHSVEPGPAVKNRILHDAFGTTVVAAASPAKISRISPVWRSAIAAGLLLLAGSIVFNFTFYSRYRSAKEDLVYARSELEKQKELAQAMHDEMGVMTDRNAMPVSLKPMPEMPDAAARIYWMQNTGEVYLDPSNLPAAPNGMQYQFWAIVNGKPVSGGMINRLRNGTVVHVQKMKSFGKAEAFAVSLEKAGPESPVPTKVYVMGKI